MNQVNIPKIMNFVNKKKRRLPLNLSDNSNQNSFLTTLANERIQAMPKDLSSAITVSSHQQTNLNQKTTIKNEIAHSS